MGFVFSGRRGCALLARRGAQGSATHRTVTSYPAVVTPTKEATGPLLSVSYRSMVSQSALCYVAVTVTLPPFGIVAAEERYVMNSRAPLETIVLQHTSSGVIQAAVDVARDALGSDVA